jgi:Uma2 family endonuclease
VHLLIEVADTSLDFDREVKLPLYARSGIREYWIVDLAGAQVEVYRGPQPDGTYSHFASVARGFEIAPADFPHAVLKVDDILPP